MKRRTLCVAVLAAAASQILSSHAFATVVQMNEFSVTRAGTQIFDDSFNRTVMLSGTAQSGTTFSDNPSISANYLVSGSFSESTASDGTATLNTANGVASFGGSPRVGAELLTGTLPSSTHLLSPSTAFSVVGLFNLSTPSVVGGAYGIELSNTNGTTGRSLEISVENCAPTVPGCGATGVFLTMTLLDFATNTATTFAKIGLTPAELADPQVELELSDPGMTDVITASYAFGSGDTLTSFNGSLTALGSTNSSTDAFSPSLQFVEPEFQAFDIEVPEPPSFLLLASGLLILGMLPHRFRARSQKP